MRRIAVQLGAIIIDPPPSPEDGPRPTDTARVLTGYRQIVDDLKAEKGELELLVLLFANTGAVNTALIDAGVRALLDDAKLDSAATVSPYDRWNPAPRLPRGRGRPAYPLRRMPARGRHALVPRLGRGDLEAARPRRPEARCPRPLLARREDPSRSSRSAAAPWTTTGRCRRWNTGSRRGRARLAAPRAHPEARPPRRSPTAAPEPVTLSFGGRPTWTVRLLAFSLALGGLRDPRLFAVAGAAAWAAVWLEQPPSAPRRRGFPGSAGPHLDSRLRPAARRLPPSRDGRRCWLRASLAASWKPREREEWLKSFLVVAAAWRRRR